MDESKIERDPAEERRQTKLHTEGVAQTFAANFLRVVREAGRPADILPGMQACIDAAHAYFAVHRVWPVYEVQNAVSLIERERRWEVDPDHVIERSMAIDEIVAGALQIAASRLANQGTQERAGESQLHRGMRELEATREKSLKAIKAEHQASVATHKLTAPKVQRRPKPRSTKPIPR